MSGVDPSHYAIGFVRRSERRRFVWTSAAVFVGLTAALFWPYASGWSTTVSDPGDPILLMWIMDWVQRALVHAPSELFDAPMFHPFHDTLAYSDPLLPQSIVSMPLRALGMGPVAAYNCIYLGTIVLAGVLTAWLFLELTGDRLASLIGAVAATYPAIRLFHLAHMQLQLTTFWPLALLLVHRIVRQPNTRGALALAVTLAAASLASLYHGIFMAMLLPPFALVVWLSSKPRSSAALLTLACAALGAVLLLSPFALVYARALSHLAQPRTPAWSDLSDYLAISRFADVGRWLPHLVVRDASPQWIGGGAAWLLPVAAVSSVVVVVRRRLRNRSGEDVVPVWVRVCLPYAVLGCLAIFLSLGPQLCWKGRAFAPNPLAHIAGLPGVREIRDFQRLGFAAALAAGAVLAMVLAALKRRRRSLAIAAQVLAGLSTLIPVVSSSLPAHRLPRAHELAPVYRWLAEQPEPVVLFEVPLSQYDEPLYFLWAAVHNHKRLVHGYSGYLPLTDVTLRSETSGAHRPDFWRALALLETTHLVVHTDRLSQLPGGAASLAYLREARTADLIARLAGAEVYRVADARLARAAPLDPKREPPAMTSVPATDCMDVRAGKPPIVLFAPRLATITGLGFISETPLGVVDDALLIERSQALRDWRPAQHQPLLSTSLAAYLRKPTSELWTRAELAPEPGPFVRLSARRDRQLRICKLWIDGAVQTPLPVPSRPSRTLRVTAHHAHHLAALAIDGDPNTRWHSAAPQSGSEWLEVDLGASQKVAAVVLELGQSAYDYARRLALDCGDTEAKLELGLEVDGQDVLFEYPQAKQILMLTPPRTCRILRIRQTGTSAEHYWSVWEVGVYDRFP